MSRQARKAPGGWVHHVYNHGNGRMRIFYRPEDYDRFVELIAEGRERTGMRVSGFCLMPTHWHMLLWPREDGDLTRFVGWVTNTHVRRWHQTHKTMGSGHVYQGRYRSFLVQPDEHVLTVLRYIEANPIRAGLVHRTRVWPWSSLQARRSNAVTLDEPPVKLPAMWHMQAMKPLETEELAALRTCLRRGRPFGSADWMAETVQRFGLESTTHNPWRPRKTSSDAAAQ